MTWLSINPNSLSSEVKAVCAVILEYKSTDVENEPLSSTELADAFNVLDPEVCGYTISDTDRVLIFSEAPDDCKFDDCE